MMSSSPTTRPLRKLFAALVLAAVLAALAAPARAVSLAGGGVPGGFALTAWEGLLDWLAGFGTSRSWRAAVGGERWPNSVTAKGCGGVDPDGRRINSAAQPATTKGCMSVDPNGRCLNSAFPPPVTKGCGGVDPNGLCKSLLPPSRATPARLDRAVRF